MFDWPDMIILPFIISFFGQICHYSQNQCKNRGYQAGCDSRKIRRPGIAKSQCIQRGNFSQKYGYYWKNELIRFETFRAMHIQDRCKQKDGENICRRMKKIALRDS